jgi:O-methyltransferase
MLLVRWSALKTAWVNEMLRLAAGAYFTWSGDSFVLGHVTKPTDQWRISPAVAGKLMAFGEPTELASFLSTVPASSNLAFKEVIYELKKYGILISGDEASTSRDPRSVEFELSRHLNLYQDIDAIDPDFQRRYSSVQPYTLTGIPLAYSLYRATRYISQAEITGAVVECGVWRGGSMLLVAQCLIEAADVGREIWLYDTFNWSWEPPGEKDGYVYDDAETKRRRLVLQNTRGQDSDERSGGVSAEEVLNRMLSTGYPGERIRLVPGLVQETLPNNAPDKIALLRLDTDFYESTRHELECLYPRIQPGGVLIIDDYGKHEGATNATDDYLSGLARPPLLHRVDIQGRICVKTAG